MIHVILRQDGDSALMYAAREGQAASVQLLLEAGADVDLENEVSGLLLARCEGVGVDCLL